MPVGSVPWWKNAVPYRRFVIESPIETSEACTRLRDAVEPRKMWRFMETTARPFQGEVSASSFTIERIILSGKSSVPRVCGEIRASSSGTEIVGTMSLRPATVAFTCLWLVAVAVLTAVNVFRLGVTPATALAMCAAFLIFGWAVLAGGFAFEAWRTANALGALFGARPVWT